jgi:hypothetical protein
MHGGTGAGRDEKRRGFKRKGGHVYCHCISEPPLCHKAGWHCRPALAVRPKSSHGIEWYKESSGLEESEVVELAT